MSGNPPPSGPPPFAPPTGTPRPPLHQPLHQAPSRGSKLMPATAAGQVVAFLVCALAAGLLAAWLGRPVVFVGSVAALGVGVIVGFSTGIGRRFTLVAGWVLATAATLATMLLVGLLETYGHVDLPYAVSPLVGLFVVGLDWCYVSRLRGAVVLSGVLVVPLLAAGKGWETAAAFAWFAGALLAFWFLERDARGSVPAPEPIVGGDAARRPTSLVDLLGVIGPALLIGLVAAMVIGNPSCTGPIGSGDLGKSFSTGQESSGDLSGRSSGRSSGSGSGSSGSSAGAGGASGDASGPPTGEPAPLFRLDRDGREQTVDGYESGGGTITGADGRQYTVSSEGGQTVVRDADGHIVARLDSDEVVATTADGESQHFQIDDQGRVFVRGFDGLRYDLDERDGQVVLVGPDGDVVASGPLSADRLTARDAQGDALIPGSGVDGGVPIPDQVVREGLLGQGRTYGAEGGDPTVSGSDGSTRAYGTDAQGRPQVRVDDGHGQVRTYVYDESDGKLEVLELDQAGNLLHRYRVDPEGTYVEGRTASGSGSGSGSATPEAASGRAGAPTEVGSHDGPDWWLIVGLAVAVTALVAGVAWWMRRSKPPVTPTWAETLVRRIDREGARRGRPRRRGETILAYTAALAEGGPDAGELPDERLTTIGRVASDALFGRHEPSEELRAWAEEAWSEIVADHPVPHRFDRFRRGAARSAAT